MLKISKSALLGVIGSIIFVVSAVVSTGQPGSFWNLPSAFITIGGTMGAVIVAYPPKRLKVLLPVIMRTFKRDKFDIKEDINTIVSLAELSRREGLLALEDNIDHYTDDEFIKRGILLIVEGADDDQLRNSLEGSTYFMKQRHQQGVAMLEMIAATAPALGLLGTYVGLIPMLNSLDDPSTLGPMMALELVSSFYGAFIAYVVFSPMAKRLKSMSVEEESRRELIIEGISAIQLGKNPKLIKEELSSYMNLDLDSEFQENNKVVNTYNTKGLVN